MRGPYARALRSTTPSLSHSTTLKAAQAAPLPFARRATIVAAYGETHDRADPRGRHRAGGYGGHAPRDGSRRAVGRMGRVAGRRGGARTGLRQRPPPAHARGD